MQLKVGNWCNKDIKVETDENKFRPSEVPFFVGCSNKLSSATAWEAKMNIIDGIRLVFE